MTAEQLDDIIENMMTSDWDSGKTKILNFARVMCDKQKEICVKHAQVYIAGKLESTYCTINPDTILNAPYPDELQGNN